MLCISFDGGKFLFIIMLFVVMYQLNILLSRGGGEQTKDIWS
jgi:hypothetical protein